MVGALPFFPHTLLGVRWRLEELLQAGLELPLREGLPDPSCCSNLAITIIPLWNSGI